ncbi:hypothetical protein COCC4DRAFT_63597 [Bipolaris maydis ATCC 48331]|uniref:Uncharacterized protein n=2 Tax=Cochliobolus heterostrophus TaxID=5016 RepID=M2TP46_COCH5|nr:uncharacterized protein COCC4DRAFT_63597 [Bipolaris maydis ATCC 48331]EMD88304.1 hypothetical protein COCHEDRAFT_1033614 [Bipolaris maydis C5]ENI02125.1 hypothetical protein COCC4DRAFT_63597 [Bipolaris maydis ATCC 48331]
MSGKLSTLVSTLSFRFRLQRSSTLAYAKVNAEATPIPIPAFAPVERLLPMFSALIGKFAETMPPKFGSIVGDPAGMNWDAGIKRLRDGEDETVWLDEIGQSLVCAVM